MEVPKGLEFVDKDNPEKGFQLKHPNRNRFVPEYSAKLGEMSLSDGVPIVRDAPPEETFGVGWPD